MAGLKNYLRRDGLLLALALLMGFLVWKYANDELTDTLSVSAKLDLVPPEGLTVTSGAPGMVKLTLRGTRRRLAVLSPADITGRYADLPATGGRVRVNLTEKNFVLPEGIQIVDLPRPFEVVLDRLEGKTFTVRPAVTGRPAAGFSLLRAFSEPPEVQVFGKKERIDELVRQSVTHIETEAVDVTGKAKSFTAYVKLDPPRDLQVAEPVKVYVEIDVEPVNREVAGVEVRLLSAAGDGLKVRVENPLIALKLRADPRVLSNLDPKSILAMVDVSGLAKSKPGAYEVPVRLQLPPGVQLAPGADAPKVQVQVLER